MEPQNNQREVVNQTIDNLTDAYCELLGQSRTVTDQFLGDLEGLKLRAKQQK